MICVKNFSSGKGGEYVRYTPGKCGVNACFSWSKLIPPNPLLPAYTPHPRGIYKSRKRPPFAKRRHKKAPFPRGNHAQPHWQCGEPFLAKNPSFYACTTKFSRVYQQPPTLAILRFKSEQIQSERQNCKGVAYCGGNGAVNACNKNSKRVVSKCE